MNVLSPLLRLNCESAIQPWERRSKFSRSLCRCLPKYTVSHLKIHYASAFFVCCILEHLPYAVGTGCVWIDILQDFHLDSHWLNITNTDDTWIIMKHLRTKRKPPYLKAQLVPRSKHFPCRLMLHMEIVAFCSEKHINTLWGLNVQFFNVQPGGTYSNHWALKG